MVSTKAMIDRMPTLQLKNDTRNNWGPNRPASATSTHMLYRLPFPTYGSALGSNQARLFSTMNSCLRKDEDDEPKLTHVSATGAAHMVSIHSKTPTTRTAKAVCTVVFSDSTAPRLIQENQMKKGDVLGVARIAGIMAAKRTPDLIPLCHPIALSHVSVDLEPSVEARPESGVQPVEKGGRADAEDGGNGAPTVSKIQIAAIVTCDGKTGVEMEALTAASAAALTVYDMCKAVDKGMRIEGLRVVLKEGGKSGRWVEGTKTD